MQQQLYNYIGTIGKIKPIQTRGNFSYREIWLYNEIFYRDRKDQLQSKIDVIPFKLLRDKVNMPENLGLKIGTILMVDFFIGGKVYKDIVFSSFDVFKVTIQGFDATAIELGVVQKEEEIITPLPVTIKAQQECPF